MSALWCVRLREISLYTQTIQVIAFYYHAKDRQLQSLFCERLAIQFLTRNHHSKMFCWLVASIFQGPVSVKNPNFTLNLPKDLTRVTFFTLSGTLDRKHGPPRYCETLSTTH